MDDGRYMLLLACRSDHMHYEVDYGLWSVDGYWVQSKVLHTGSSIIRWTAASDILLFLSSPITK